MAGRNVYGNSVGEDGWPFVDEAGCTWVTVPGTSVTLQIQSGQPLAIMRAFAADFNAYVEPLRDADSACWTATNSVATSNHLGGTAMDLNWNSHPFQILNAGFDGSEIGTVRELLDFYEDTIWWGNDWNSPKDAMHFQMGYDTYQNAHTADFIARKIRADGYSTFRRDNAPVPPPVVQPLSRADGYAVKIIAEGQRRGITPRGIEIALATGLVESNLTIYANAKVPASMDIPHDAVGSDGYSVGIFQQQVRDTGGGWWWGDAATCMDPTTSAGLFYDHLVRLDYNGSNSPGSYAQAVQQSAFPDRYDQRFNDAVAIYNRLANVTTDPGDDDLSAEAERMIKELYDEYRKEKQGPSRSFMVPDGNPVDSPLGFLWNIDGNVENINITLGYLFGTTLSEEFVNTVASTGVAPASWAGNVNQAWLQQYGQQWCLGLISFRAAIQKAFKAAGAAPAGVTVQSADPVLTEAFSTEVAAKTASAVGATVRAAVQQAPVPAVVAPVELATTPSDEASNIADLYRSLKSLGLADALPIEGRAPLAALISILQTKNGTQLGATS